MHKFITAAALAVSMLSPAFAADNLVVYSAGPKPLSGALAKAFTAKTGIDVDLFQSTAGKVMARYEAEKSNPQVDVIVSAAWGHAITLAEKDELVSYTSPNAANVPNSLKTENYVAQGAAAIAIAYNTNSNLPVPSNWSDLTKPEYKGQVTMPDPSASGAALTLLQGLLSQDSDAAWELFKGLKANDMIVPGANNAALNPVLQGAKGAVFGAVDYIALGSKAKGEAIDVIYPSEGTVLAPRPMMILKSSDNQSAAKQFIDFVLSEEGQAMVSDQLILPARTDIKAQRPGYDELNIIDFDQVQAAKSAAADKAEFTELMGL